MFTDEMNGSTVYEIDDIVKAFDDKPLHGNDVAPPIVIGEEYTVKNIVLDSRYNQHLDLGLKSKYNWITSWNTGENLPNGDKVHWVHPSRVIFLR